MRVIAKSRLREFWEFRKSDSKIAERDLSAWYKLAMSAEWGNFADLKQTFGSADLVGELYGLRCREQPLPPDQSRKLRQGDRLCPQSDGSRRVRQGPMC